jgi:hypothetical protein
VSIVVAFAVGMVAGPLFVAAGCLVYLIGKGWLSEVGR